MFSVNVMVAHDFRRMLVIVAQNLPLPARETPYKIPAQVFWLAAL